MKIFKILLFTILLIICFLTVQVNILFFQNSYSEFITYITGVLDQPSWKPFLETRFPVERFLLCRKLLIGCDLIIGVVIISLFVWVKQVYAFLLPVFIKSGVYGRQLLSPLDGLPRYCKIVLRALLVFALAKALYYAIVIPLQYDEMWTYIHYTSGKWWQSFYLPGNNHKLYTAIAWWFNLLPFDRGLLMRLPSVFGGIVLIVLFILLVKRYFHPAVVVIGVTWFATASPVAIYMFLGRSYLFVLLFTVLLVSFTLKLLETKKPGRADWLFYCLVLIGGYWANPVFFFGHLFITINTIVLLIKNGRLTGICKLLLVNVVAGLVLAGLYAPDILGQHFNALMDRALVPGPKPNYFLRCIKYNSYFQWGVLNSGWVSGVLTGVSLILLFYPSNYRKLLFLALTGILLLPFFTYIVNDLIMHVTIYLVIYFAVLIMCVLDKVFTRMRPGNYLVMFLCLVVAGYNSYRMNNLGYLNYSRYQDEHGKITAEVMQAEQISNCYLFFNLYKPAILYYYRVAGKKIELKMASEKSIDHTEYSPAVHYQCIIVDKEHPILPDTMIYRQILQDTLVSVWKLR